MTTLRSRPCGRGGAGGPLPARMRGGPPGRLPTAPLAPDPRDRQLPSWPSLRGRHLRGFNEAIAAHPHAVVRLGHIGDEVAALIVRDDNLAEPGRQILRFRNHPAARLRTFRAGDHAAEVIAVDSDRFAPRLTG